MAKLICAGHASCDIPMSPVDKGAFDVDTTFIEHSTVVTGGDALNASVNLTRLGVGDEILFVGVVGDDVFGRITTDYLKGRGVNTSGIIVKPECNSIYTVILIDKNNERHFLFYGNAARNLSVDDVIAQIGDDTEYLHIGSLMSLDMLEYDNLKRLFSYAQERGVHTSFDVTYDQTEAWFKKLEAGFPYTDIFFASYEEGIKISGGLTDPAEMAEYFKNCGVKKFVLKLGEKGCYATDFERVIEVPAYTGLRVVDTTGAGDAFVSGYLFGLMKGFSMEECCVLGNVNGSLAIASLGANTGTGTVQDVIDFIGKHGALTLDAQSLCERLKAFL